MKYKLYPDRYMSSEYMSKGPLHIDIFTKTDDACIVLYI